MAQYYKESLRMQIREAYGRLLYTYTCYNKMIDNLTSRLNRLQIWQIILSAITTGGLMTAVIVDEQIVTIVSCIISTILTGITLYLKNYNLNDRIRQFQTAADEAWLIREDYISLLTDLDNIPETEIVTKRESLEQRVYDLYKKSPKTNLKSYNQTQNALKCEEEQFFTVEELNKMLPLHLRISKK
jgi:hypothetical protein